MCQQIQSAGLLKPSIIMSEKAIDNPHHTVLLKVVLSVFRVVCLIDQRGMLVLTCWVLFVLWWRCAIKNTCLLSGYNPCSRMHWLAWPKCRPRNQLFLESSLFSSLPATKFYNTRLKTNLAMSASLRILSSSLLSKHSFIQRPVMKSTKKRAKMNEETPIWLQELQK
jgi:hypothetical protein